MTQGMIDRGADISRLSQYPHEKEILFPPCTGLEVQGSRVEDNVLIISVRPSLCLMTLTLEQVIGKRKKLLGDMLGGLEADLRLDTAREGYAKRKGIDFVWEELVRRCKAGALKHDDTWYIDDEHLEQALRELLETKRLMGPGGPSRAEALAALSASQCIEYGFPAEAFSEKAMSHLKSLSNPESRWNTKEAAVKSLGQSKEMAAQHKMALVDAMADPNQNVREAAVEALKKLDPKLVEGVCVKKPKSPHSRKPQMATEASLSGLMSGLSLGGVKTQEAPQEAMPEVEPPVADESEVVASHTLIGVVSEDDTPEEERIYLILAPSEAIPEADAPSEAPTTTQEAAAPTEVNVDEPSTVVRVLFDVPVPSFATQHFTSPQQPPADLVQDAVDATPDESSVEMNKQPQGNEEEEEDDDDDDIVADSEETEDDSEDDAHGWAQMRRKMRMDEDDDDVDE